MRNTAAARTAAGIGNSGTAVLMMATGRLKDAFPGLAFGGRFTAPATMFIERVS